jgi:hypothetical protein
MYLNKLIGFSEPSVLGTTGSEYESMNRRFQLLLSI